MQTDSCIYDRAAMERLRRAAVDRVLPDSTPYRSIDEAHLRDIALESGLALRQVQVMALRQEIVPERYVRNFQTMSLDDQIRLLHSRAVLVGLGGLGGWVLELLARAGVGDILAVDHDAFEESNLNRQLLASRASLDEPKTEAALQRVQAVNPAVALSVARTFARREHLEEMLRGADVAIDALGGLASRPALQAAASMAGVPLVTAAVAGWTGYVAVVFPGGPGPADLFGDRSSSAEDSLGTPGPTVAAAAALQAAQAIRLLCGHARAAHGKTLVFDLADLTFESLKL